jgi:hypothetical protein
MTMADKPDDDATPAPNGPTDDGRRRDDRRKAQLPFDGPDRRQGDRRSGTDRRKTPRASGDDHAGED